MYIAFEGIDGAGTTTQANKLAAYIREQSCEGGIVQVVGPFSEDGLWGQLAWDLLGDEGVKFDNGLFEIDSPNATLRNAFIEQSVEIDRIMRETPHADMVISDRYWLSCLVYQDVGSWGFGEPGDEPVFMEGFERWTTDMKVPCVVVFLDTSPEVAMKRIQSRGEALGRYENLDLLRKHRARYLNCLKWQLASKGDPRVKTLHLDGDRGEDEVFRDIIKTLRV